MRITLTGITGALLPLALTVLALTVSLAACGAADAGSGSRSGAGSENASGPQWHEPRDYAYTLTQECGEQSLLGTFRVSVEDGRTVGWEPVGENHTPRTVEVPSIGGLLARAEEARQDGADSVEVERADDGRPTLITIDHDADAVDDETCYTVSEVDPAAPDA